MIGWPVVQMARFTISDIIQAVIEVDLLPGDWRMAYRAFTTEMRFWNLLEVTVTAQIRCSSILCVGMAG